MSSDFYGGYYQGSPSPQTILDHEHLRLLRMGYFISAGVTALIIPIGLLYAVMGFLLPTLPSRSGPPTPNFMPWVFGIIGGAMTVFSALSTLLKVLTAVRLKERRSRTLCLVTAGLACFEIPYGMALGIMTFVVLGRPSVRQEFERSGGP